MAIIAAHEFARFKTPKRFVNPAAKIISNKTSRPIGIINEWYEKLFGTGKPGRIFLGTQQPIRSGLWSRKCIRYFLSRRLWKNETEC